MDISNWHILTESPVAILLTALVLGLVHGITPDEHTWPITFSYAIGSYSTRAGLRAGLLFSLAFTVQRAIGSELAWLGLSPWLGNARFDKILFLLIGVLMAVGGWMMHRRGSSPHLDWFSNKLPARRTNSENTSTMLGWMPAIHGFVAGWGFGAFALILYTTLAPNMPSAWWGWVPGAMFGLGTTVVQALAGAGFGWLMASRKLTPEILHKVALTTASRTLLWGGLAYILLGLLGLAAPHIESLRLGTGMRIPGLAHIGVPVLFAAFTVLIVGIGTLYRQLRLYPSQPQSDEPHTPE